MRTKFSIVLNNQSNPERRKQQYSINPASYIRGLKKISEDATNAISSLEMEIEMDVEMEMEYAMEGDIILMSEYLEKVSKRKRKGGFSVQMQTYPHHYEAAKYVTIFKTYDQILEGYRLEVYESEELIVDFFSDETYPWLIDDKLSYDHINYLIKIANEYGKYPLSESETQGMAA